MCAHGFFDSGHLCYAMLRPKKSFQKQLKPAKAKAIAKAAAAAKAAAEAEGKSKAKAKKESHTHADTAKPNYVVRKHKRKVADGHVRIFAINSTQTGKQVCQLTETACNDAENVVTGMVARLNEEKITLASALDEMNQLKGTA